MTSPAPTQRSTQIILLALALGVLTFTAVVVGMRVTTEPTLDPELGRLLLVVAALLAAGEVGAFVVLRRTFVARARAVREESLALVKDGRTPLPLHAFAIIGGALAEGVGLLGTVGLLLGAPWYGLAVPLLAVAAILLQLPTRERLERTLRGS